MIGVGVEDAGTGAIVGLDVGVGTAVGPGVGLATGTAKEVGRGVIVGAETVGVAVGETVGGCVDTAVGSAVADPVHATKTMAITVTSMAAIIFLLVFASAISIVRSRCAARFPWLRYSG